MANHIATTSKLNPEAPSFTPQNYQTQSFTTYFPDINIPQYHNHNHNNIFFSSISVPTVVIPSHHDYQTWVMQYQPPNEPILIRSGSPSDGQYVSPSRTRSSGRQMRPRGNYHNANANYYHNIHGGTRVSSWQREKNNKNARLFHQSASSSTKRPTKFSSVRKPCGSSILPSSSSPLTRVKVNADDHGNNDNVITTLMIKNIPSKYTYV